MTLLRIVNLPLHGTAVSWSGMAYNRDIVTLRDIVSGALFMGITY